jgi:hypothetical protein
MPGGQSSSQKGQNKQTKKGLLEELRPNFTKSERKGPKEIFTRSSLF